MTDSDQPLEGLAEALDVTASQLYAIAKQVERWALDAAPTAQARAYAVVLAGDLGSGAALLSAAVEQAAMLERHLAAQVGDA